MSDNIKGCIKNYFANASNIGAQLNLISMSGDPLNGFLITFTRPWLFMGVMTLDPLPPAPADPSFPLSEMHELDPTENANYARLLTMLFISCMYANRDLTYANGAVNYVSGGFSRYFERYLNVEQLPANYYSFLFPPNIVQDFLINLAPIMYTTGIPLQVIQQLARDIMTVSDKRLFGAPGTYSFTPPTGAAPGTEVQLTQCFDISAPVGDLQNTQLNYLDPPNIILSNASTYAKAAVSMGGGIDVFWGSTEAKYTDILCDWDAHPQDTAGRAAAVAEFVAKIFVAITGDPGEPYANFTGNTLLTYTIPEVTIDPVSLGCTLDTPTAFSIRYATNRNYKWGKLGLAAPNPGDTYELFVNFYNSSDETPFWNYLVGLYNEEGEAPKFAVLEFKSVE